MLVNYFFIFEIFEKCKKKILIDHLYNNFRSEYQNFLILSHLSETIDVPAWCQFCVSFDGMDL